MMNYQTRVYLVSLLLIVSLVVTVSVASLALAKRDAFVYPSNLYAGPVYLGHLTRAEALQKLEESITESLEVTCVLSHGDFPMKLRDMGVQLNAEATIKKIDAIIESWSPLHHTLHRGKKHIVAPVWEYDFDKMRQSLYNLALSKHRPAVDARLILCGDQLVYYPEQEGTQIDAEMSVNIVTQFLNAGQLKVTLPEKPITPTLISINTSRIQELLSVRAVPDHEKFPTGEDTGWAVPGKIILPGESAYINISIDASSEDAEAMVELWHQALARSALDAGLVYEAGDMQMYNPGTEPVAVFINRDHNSWLIRIYGHNETGEKITFSRTYTPLVTSSTGAGEKPRIQQLYRHELKGDQLQATELLGEKLPSHMAHSTEPDGKVNQEATVYK